MYIGINIEIKVILGELAGKFLSFKRKQFFQLFHPVVMRKLARCRLVWLRIFFTTSVPKHLTDNAFPWIIAHNLRVFNHYEVQVFFGKEKRNKVNDKNEQFWRPKSQKPKYIFFQNVKWKCFRMLRILVRLQKLAFDKNWTHFQIIWDPRYWSHWIDLTCFSMLWRWFFVGKSAKIEVMVVIWQIYQPHV